MIPAEYSVEIPDTTTPINLWGLGDFHVGNFTFDEGNLKRTIKGVATDDYARVFLMGDHIEAIGKKDPRFVAECIPDKFITDLDDIFVAQTDYVVDLLMPIADKIIGVHGGNHEKSTLKHNSFNALKYLVRELNAVSQNKILNLGYGGALTRFHIKRGIHTSTLIISTAHGRGGGEQKGGKANRLQRLTGKIDADIYLRGHTHELWGFGQPQIGMPRKGNLKILANPKVLAYCGCYFQTYAEGAASYGEELEYYPTEMGSPRLRIKAEPYEIETTIRSSTSDLSQLRDYVQP